MNRLLLAFVLSFAAPLSSAQIASTLSAATKAADYSKEAVVVEQFRNINRFENDGTGAREVSAKIRVQSEAGVQRFGLLVFGYDKASEDLKIDYVRVRKPDGSIVPTPLESVQDMPADVTREAPIYSDVRQKHVAVVALRPGDTLEYKLAARMTTPLIPGQFWLDADFDRDVIALDEQVVLDIPANRPLKLYVADGISSQVREENGRKIYTWSSSNLKHEEKQQRIGSQKPELIEPPIQATSFQNWDEFAKWFSQIQYAGAPAPEVAAKADEMTRGLRTPSEKAEAIYAFVAREIRYVGLEFGIGRFQAHRAETVLANRYGDCKDKHTLLASMLQSVGIPAYPVLVHANRKFRHDMPSPSQFNHLMTAVFLGKDRVFLDATAEVAPFGMLVSVVRDKEALIVLPSASPEITRTPADPPFEQFKTLDVEGSVDAKGKLDARITQTLRGDQELLFRAAFRHTPQDKWKDIAQAVSFMTGFGGEVSDVSTSDIENTSLPLQIKYHYTRENYVTWNGDTGSMRVALPAMGLPAADAPGESGDTQREPVQLGSPIELTYSAILKIPPDAAAREFPAVDMDTVFADYHSKSKLDGDKITIERTLVTKQREVATARRSDYEKFYKAVSNDADGELQITRTSAAQRQDAKSAGASDQEPVPGDAEFHEGVNAMGRGDMFTALSKYQQAVKINPSHPYAWAELARVHAMMRDADQALAEARKQLQVNPNHPDADMLIAGLLMMKGDSDGALTETKKHVAAHPDDQRARLALTDIYLQRHNYKEALPQLEEVAKAGPLESRVAEPLALAYLKTGSADKALAVYGDLLRADPNPSLFNAVAYTFAEEGVYLDRALQWAEQSVALTSDRLKNVDLATMSDDDLKSVTSLFAVWDTLGWIYAKRGDLEKAKTYLNAAWTSMQGSEVAEHLAYVYDRLGMKNKATEFRSYASGGQEPGIVGPGGTFTPPRPIHPALRRDGKSYYAVTERLQEMRTVHLARKFNGDASGEFWVLLSQTGVQDVKFIDGSQALADWTTTLKSAKYPIAFPDQLGAKVVRRGILSCHSTCMMVLLEPGRVRSVE